MSIWQIMTMALLISAAVASIISIIWISIERRAESEIVSKWKRIGDLNNKIHKEERRLKSFGEIDYVNDRRSTIEAGAISEIVKTLSALRTEREKLINSL